MKRLAACAIALGPAASLLTLSLKQAAFSEAMQSSTAREKNSLNETQDRLIKKQVFHQPKVELAEPIANRELGLFADLSFDKRDDLTYVEGLLKRKEVNGIACLFAWRELEDHETVLTLSKVDALVQLCKKYNKTLILKVSTAGGQFGTADGGGGSPSQLPSDAPAWVFASGAKSADVPIDVKGNQQIIKVPIFWDPIYLAKWTNFVNAVGAKYDREPALHSIAITGGGIGAGTGVLPKDLTSKEKIEDLNLPAPRMVTHWKNIVDIFARAFPNTHLDFDAEPPNAGKSGEDSLDEITDYIEFRYGERVYLVRRNTDAKHGYDQYRVLAKFRNDTLIGYELNAQADDEMLSKIVKSAGDDSLSFAEIPSGLFDQADDRIKSLLTQLRTRLGYQLIAQSVTLPDAIDSGEALNAGFKFVNVGAATPMRPNRELDRDVPTSYKVQLRLIDESGKAVAVTRHTPPIPTTKWTTGKVVSWDRELKLPPLAPGNYKVWMSVIDDNSKRKLQIMNGSQASKVEPEYDIAVGNLKVDRAP